jgi:CDP-paratose 2-epimerase
MTGKRLDWKYVDEPRKGDHICYISDLRKFQAHYPNWKITRSLDSIFQEIIAAQQTEHTSGVAR